MNVWRSPHWEGATSESELQAQGQAARVTYRGCDRDDVCIGIGSIDVVQGERRIGIPRIEVIEGVVRFGAELQHPPLAPQSHVFHQREIEVLVTWTVE